MSMNSSDIRGPRRERRVRGGFRGGRGGGSVQMESFPEESKSEF